MGSVPFAVGAFSKLFLKAGTRSVRVDGLPQFLERLQGERGVLTGAPALSPLLLGKGAALTRLHGIQSPTTSRCASSSLPSSPPAARELTVVLISPLPSGFAKQGRRALHVGHAPAALLPRLAQDPLDPRRERRHVQRPSPPSPSRTDEAVKADPALSLLLQGKWDRWFFEKGQVIETFRGKGIYQRAIDESSKKLDAGNWVRPRSLSSLLVARRSRADLGTRARRFTSSPRAGSSRTTCTRSGGSSGGSAAS